MTKSFLAALAAGIFLVAAGGQAAEQLPNMGGNYRCVPVSSSCQNSGASFTVTQMGNGLDVKNDKNDIGHGTMTSNITISMGPPWNMLGVISNNNRTVEWSNGTQWQKQ